MKKSEIFSLFLTLSVILPSCDALETKMDLSLTEEMMDTRYYQMFDWGYRVYEYIPYGFTAIDGNLFAGVTDEAQYVTSVSSTQRFNEGSWNIYTNPDEKYSSYFNGIYAAHNYLDKSKNYKYILGRNRDTLTSNGLDSYYRDIDDVKRLRSESHVLKAYYYLELLKRYGGVPIINKVYENPSEANLPRATVDEVIDLIVNEIESVKYDLVIDWNQIGQGDRNGRITRGAALAVKSRALLYAASPLFNPQNDKMKWEKAVSAAYEVMNMNMYSLDPSYASLFVGDYTNTSPEMIWAVRLGQTNDFERANYPIGTQGGGTGICPTQNLVDAYEYKGQQTDDPYENKDPRFYCTVVRNGDTWNGRTMEIWDGGTDDPANANTSPTGYYLRKFLNDNLNLTNNVLAIRSWPVFRYAEILLNFAEAMNEAYGPDDPHGYGMTAREAVNMVRARQDVDMPPVDVPSGDVAGMRIAIKHERQIELAFEDHRYWDLRRWNDAGDVLNSPVRGVRVTKDGDTFHYTYYDVADRVFDAPKMNLYPIAQSEIVKSGGVLEQNPGW